MDLVEDNEFVLVSGKIKFRLGEFGTIRVGFEIEIDRRPLLADLQCEDGSPHLSRPEQGDRWIVIEVARRALLFSVLV